MPPGEPLFFESRAAFRAWLHDNHASVDELWLGMYKKASGRPTVTYVEAVEEALCFGWIDGVRYSVDEVCFKQRFTPRRAGSNWSAINIKRVEVLMAQGLMHAAGLREFEVRKLAAAGYSHESEAQALPQPNLARLKASPAAWAFFSGQAPWYQRAAAFWVMDAKREETRERRLGTLIADSEAGRRIKPLSRPGEG